VTSMLHGIYSKLEVQESKVAGAPPRVNKGELLKAFRKAGHCAVFFAHQQYILKIAAEKVTEETIVQVGEQAGGTADDTEVSFEDFKQAYKNQIAASKSEDPGTVEVPQPEEAQLQSLFDQCTPSKPDENEWPAKKVRLAELHKAMKRVPAVAVLFGLRREMYDDALQTVTDDMMKNIFDQIDGEDETTDVSFEELRLAFRKASVFPETDAPAPPPAPPQEPTKPEETTPAEQ